MAIDHAQGFSARGRGVVRAVVIRAIVGHLAHDFQARPGRPRIEAQHEVVLVVGQLNVEARLVALDQVVFQQQRFFFVAGHHRLDVGHDAFQKRNEGPCVAAGRLEILPDARAQVGCFPDVDDLAAPVFHQVNAGLGRQAIQDFGKAPLGRRHLGVSQRGNIEGVTVGLGHSRLSLAAMPVSQEASTGRNQGSEPESR